MTKFTAEHTLNTGYLNYFIKEDIEEYHCFDEITMLRTVLGYIYLVLYLFYSVPILLKVVHLDKKGRVSERDKLVHQTAQRWAKAFMRYSKSEVAVVGEENLPKDRAVLFVGNHQSIYDIVILLAYVKQPIAFVAKIEIARIPIISTWMRYMNCIFMDRDDARQSLRAINQGAKNLKNGYSYVIFPEGTRTVSGELDEFKPGSFKLAIKAGAPIVPFTFIDSYKIMSKDRFSLSKASVKLIFLPPVYIEDIDIKDTKKLADNVRQIINKELIS